MRALVIVEVEGLFFIWSRSCVFTRASYVPPARGVCLCVARAVCLCALRGVCWLADANTPPRQHHLLACFVSLPRGYLTHTRPRLTHKRITRSSGGHSIPYNRNS